MPRYSEFSHRPGWLFTPGKIQRLQEEIGSIKRKLRHWTERDKAVAWLKIQSIEKIVGHLDRLLDQRNADEISERDYAQLAAEADLWLAEQHARANAKRLAESNVALAEAHGRLAALEKAAGKATTSAECRQILKQPEKAADDIRSTKK